MLKKDGENENAKENEDILGDFEEEAAKEEIDPLKKTKQSIIYEKINKKVGKNKVTIRCPKGILPKFAYVFMIPITHLTYFTIPDPKSKGRENFYPLTLTMSIFWIWIYTFFIVWWTYSVSNAWGISFSIIPMILYPIGISIRDRKKFVDFIQINKLFRDELADQEISLAETYSGSIFQITGLMGFAWTIYTLISGTTISFTNQNIAYQAPLLLATVMIKYLVLAVRKFRSTKIAFFMNIVNYVVFQAAALIIDYA